MLEEAARGILLANMLHKTYATPFFNPDNLSRVDIHLVEGTSYFYINYGRAWYHCSPVRTTSDRL